MKCRAIQAAARTLIILALSLALEGPAASAQVEDEAQLVSLQMAPQQANPNRTDQQLLAGAHGNPRATSVFLDGSAFDRHGWAAERYPRDPSWPDARGWTSRFDAEFGQLRLGDARGQYYAGTVSSEYRFAERLSLSLAMPIQYRRVEGAGVYDVGGEIGLPIRIIDDPDSPWSWQLTPIATIGAVRGPDFEVGGVTWGGGITSSVAYRMNRTSIVWGQQLTHHENTSIEIAGYHLDGELVQQILRTGLKMTQELGRDLTLEVGVVYTRMLQSAPVRSFTTPLIGARLQIGESMDFRLGYSNDIGGGEHRHGARAGLLIVW